MSTKSWALAFVAACIFSTSTGCSVYLAGKGHPGANLEAFGVGTPEQEVEGQLGTPSIIEPFDGDKRRVVYRFQLTKQPNRQRALIHLLIDCATYGIWELPATIYELRIAPRMGEAEFVYGPDDRILEIRGAPFTQTQATSASEPLPQTKSPLELWNTFASAQ